MGRKKNEVGKVGREKWATKWGEKNVAKKKWGVISRARKVGQSEKWGLISGARKVGQEKVGQENWSEKSEARKESQEKWA